MTGRHVKSNIFLRDLAAIWRFRSTVSTRFSFSNIIAEKIHYLSPPVATLCKCDILHYRKEDSIRESSCAFIIGNSSALLSSWASLRLSLKWAVHNNLKKTSAWLLHRIASRSTLKHVLVIGQTKGFEHDSVSPRWLPFTTWAKRAAYGTTMLRTDTELLTKKELKNNAKNLNYFDLIVFASTTGELEMDASQKADMMSFIKEDGKGFVGIHAALDTNYTWPEYGEMIGGWFDQHPWMTFNAPIINEDPSFPAVRHFPNEFVKYDEIYQPKEWSRSNVNVLLSLDASRLDYANNPRIHRADHDFRGGLEQDVRQGPRLLLDAWPHGRGVGRSGHSQDVL